MSTLILQQTNLQSIHFLNSKYYFKAHNGIFPKFKRHASSIRSIGPVGLRPIHTVRFFLIAIAFFYIAWNGLHGCQ